MRSKRSPSKLVPPAVAAAGDRTDASAHAPVLGDAISSDSVGAVLNVLVTPRAGVTAFRGVEVGFLRVRIVAPPVDGAANKALVRFLADVTDIAPSRIQVVAGETARRKRLRFVGLAADELAARLDAVT